MREVLNRFSVAVNRKSNTKKQHSQLSIILFILTETLDLGDLSVSPLNTNGLSIVKTYLG